MSRKGYTLPKKVV